MFRLRLWFATALPLLAVQPLMAANSVVGTCKTRLTSYTSISEAVSKATRGSTIFVCAGTYAEQVVISRPLTLQGIADSNQGQAVITVPPGFAANAVTIMNGGVAAQVLVQTARPVNITNISVDGTGGNLACSSTTMVAGIFYANGSSGEIDRVKVSGQQGGGCGVGILAENDGSSRGYVTVEDSSVHDTDNSGIFVMEGGPIPTLYVNLQGNVVSPNCMVINGVISCGLIGIGLANVAADVSGNDVSNAMFGIADVGTAVEIESNTLTKTSAGIVLEGGGAVTNNRVSDSSLGVWFFSSGGTVVSNRITNTTVAAIEFNCNTATVAHNMINDAPLGLDMAPLGVSGSNTFSNTATISVDGCPPPAAPQAGAAVRGSPASSWGGSILQWRTPASPFGTLK